MVRRPMAVFSIVFGPFLVLALFGLGFVGPPALRTALVIPEGSGLPTDTASYTPDTGPQIVIVGIVDDPATARADLRAGALDLIVIAPADGRDQLERGEQAVLTVEYDSVSPFWASVAHTAADRVAAAANRRLIETVLTEASAEAARAGQPLPPAARPKLLAAPTRAEVRDLAPTEPTILWFYGVAVLVLIIQHVAVSVSSLSILHDRQRGAVDLFRVSPDPRDRAAGGQVPGLRDAQHARRRHRPRPAGGRFRGPAPRDRQSMSSSPSACWSSRRRGSACWSRSSPTPTVKPSSWPSSSCWPPSSSAAWPSTVRTSRRSSRP